MRERSLLSFLSIALAGALISGSAITWALTAELEAKLLASDGARLDNFGRDLDIDGDMAIIGAPDDGDNGVWSGSSYVFTRTDGVWTEQAKLLPADGERLDHFGESVAIEDGIVMIGTYLDDDSGPASGSVYVFTQSGGEWAETGKLLAEDGAEFDYFGSAVALDGDTAVIGASGAGDNGHTSGAAYVFIRLGDIWAEQAKLLPSDGVLFDRFGSTVAIDGDTILIGAYGDDDSGLKSGSAFVFKRTGSIWVEQAKLLPSDGERNDQFGISVAVDGDTAVIGADLGGDNGINSGSAYVFRRNAGVWTEHAKLLPADGEAYDLFGNSVALDGGTAVIGAYGDDDLSYLGGSAYIFTRTLGVWSEHSKLLARDLGGFLRFGFRVALNDDTTVIGAPGDWDNGAESGSTYAYRLDLPDRDGDGIDDEIDACLGTVIPELSPTTDLGVNRWALVDENESFDTTSPPGDGNGPRFEFTIEGTSGCSCEQIVEAMGLGWGHAKYGCSTGVMLQWIATANISKRTVPVQRN